MPSLRLRCACLAIFTLAATAQFPLRAVEDEVAAKERAADEGYVCFDTDTLRMAAGWTGGFLKLQKTNIGTYKGDGTGAAEIASEVQFRTGEGPGWSLATTESNDAGNFSIEQYNDKWWSSYGSSDLSLAHPGKKGRDKVKVKAAKLSADGKTVIGSTINKAP